MFEEFACLWGCVTSFCETTHSSSEAFSLTGLKNIPIFSEIQPTEALPYWWGTWDVGFGYQFFVKKSVKIDRERLPQWRWTVCQFRDRFVGIQFLNVLMQSSSVQPWLRNTEKARWCTRQLHFCVTFASSGLYHRMLTHPNIHNSLLSLGDFAWWCSTLLYVWHVSTILSLEVYWDSSGFSKKHPKN